MDNKIVLQISFVEDRIYVKGQVTLATPINSFQFSLNKKLSDVCVHSGKLTATDISLPFRPPCNQYEASFNVRRNKITISFEGPINGWMSFIEDTRIAVNFYTAWYPIIDDIEFDDITVILYGLEDYVVLNAEFDSLERTWVLSNNPDDPYNILAFRKDKNLVHENVNATATAYYFDHSEEQAAITSVNSVEDIIKYFNNNLFSKKEFGRYLLVSFSNQDDTGGYIRGNLIVANHFESDVGSAISFIAHEIAHEWCSGADFSFEDWLNETTAEWASLLYILEAKRDTEYFNKKIKYHKEIAEASPPIKPKNLKRPEKGVHSKGTVLLFEIYEKYGTESVKSLLRIYVSLEIKTTEEFIKQVENYNMDIASYLVKGILLK